MTHAPSREPPRSPGRQRRLLSVALVFALSLLAVSETRARTITFAGLVWDVRSHTGAPGNGCWSDTPESVWVDDSGYLHLRIIKLADGRWCQAEVRARSFATYGDHLFWTNSRIDQLDPTTVLGMFLYADDYHEIDIEATRAFNPDVNLGFVVQPGYDGAPRSSNWTTFSLNGTDGGAYSSHRFTWQDDESVLFASWHGHCLEPPCGGTIEEWTYLGPNTPSHRELLQPRINLWSRGGDPPSPQEVIIASYMGEQIPRPKTTTGKASEVTPTNVVLNGTVNPNGWSATGWFEYGTSTDYPSSTEGTKEAVGDGSEPVAVSHAISFDCGTTYHFRAVGSNVAGLSWGDDHSFNTLSCPPVVSTAPASEIGPTFATLNGLVHPNGASSVVFEYGPTTSYGSSAYPRTIEGSDEQAVATVVAPLQCESTYHFRAVATNEGGTSVGEDRTFTTTSCADVPQRRRPARRDR